MLKSVVGLDMPNFASNFDDILQMLDIVSAIDPGPGTTSTESGDILAMPDFVRGFDPGPGEPLLESGVDFVSAINPGNWETSPESGDILAVPDFVSNLFGSGGSIPGDRDSVFALCSPGVA